MHRRPWLQIQRERKISYDSLFDCRCTTNPLVTRRFDIDFDKVENISRWQSMKMQLTAFRFAAMMVSFCIRQFIDS